MNASITEIPKNTLIVSQCGHFDVHISPEATSWASAFVRAFVRYYLDHLAADITNQVSNRAAVLYDQAAVALRTGCDFVRNNEVSAFVDGHASHLRSTVQGGSCRWMGMAGIFDERDGGALRETAAGLTPHVTSDSIRGWTGRPVPSVDLLVLKEARDTAWNAYQAELQKFDHVKGTNPDLLEVFRLRGKIEAAHAAFDLANERYTNALLNPPPEDASNR